MDKKIITVFGSYRPKEGEKAYKEAYEVGKILATAGYAICNGGYAGTMEACSRGAQEAGGYTIGVTVTGLNDRSKPNPWNNEVLEHKTLLQRLEHLITIADGYIVLSGGTGTLAELSLAWEFVNKRIISPKPIVFLGSYWLPILEVLENEDQLGEKRGAVQVSQWRSFVRSVESTSEILSELEKPILL